MESPRELPPEPLPSGGNGGVARDERASRRPPASAAELDAIVAALQENDPESRRYSLAGLLVIMTIASVVLSLGAQLPRDVFAGAVGVATLVSMVALSAMQDPPRVLQVGWWVLLLIYLIAIASAVWA